MLLIGMYSSDVYFQAAILFLQFISASFSLQYFRREETNFISQNEIDNMTLIMPTATSRRQNTAPDPVSSSSGKVKVGQLLTTRAFPQSYF